MATGGHATRITVVVPVIDRAITVRPTLDSIAAQTRSPSRLVVVDDGSTDDTPDAVERWIAERRPPFECEVIRQSHRGASAARNVGLERCGSEGFVAFLDSDDVWPSDFLARAGRALESSPSALAASCDRRFVLNGKAQPIQSTEGLSMNAARWLLEENHGGIGSATLCSVTAVRALGGFREDLHTGADLALFLRMALGGPWLHVQGNPVNFYVGDVRPAGEAGHLSRAFVDRGRIWGSVLEEALDEFGDQKNFPREACLSAIGRLYCIGHKELTAAGRVAEGQECLDRAARHRFPTPIRVSVVVEWENVLLSDLDRCRQMLRRLSAQAEALRDGSEDLHGVLACLAFPFELIIAFDPDKVDQRLIEQALAESVAAPEGVLFMRLEPARGLNYYEFKNHGATKATGDVVILLDSDVIPEAGWLERLVSSFDNPSVRLVGGNTFIEPVTTYDKAFAVGWFFPLRAAELRLERSNYFFANNVAFERALLLEHPFEPIPGQTRGACTRLAERLVGLGIRPYLNFGAQVSHPPPNGVFHLVVRAIAHARDDHIADLDRADAERRTAFRGWRRAASRFRRGLRRLVGNRRDLHISWIEMPGASALIAAYYLSYALGDVLVRVAPQMTRTRFRI